MTNRVRVGPARTDNRPGTMRAAIEAHGGATALFSAKDRNQLVRWAMIAGGDAWRSAFLPQRFTNYVMRRPFGYPKHSDGFFKNKARRMGLLKSLCDKFLQGWDPWAQGASFPFQLFLSWKRNNAGAYRQTRAENDRAKRDFRNWAKRLLMNQVAEMKAKGVFQPLVESGQLRESAISKSRATATATATRGNLTIKVPYPGARHPSVAGIIRALPEWEVRFISKHVGDALAKLLESTNPQSTNRRGQRTIVGASSRVTYSRANPRDAFGGYSSAALDADSEAG